MLSRMYYFGVKILGLTVFFVPLILNALGILTELSKVTVITLIVIGTLLLLLGDGLERKHKRKVQESNFK
ncbi:hypothetical protein [Bacillus pinisoli]|uniref:hypothetical protein n=1 Tax=Bacillus pinisoli TaxID=2901866 RepID=UPI001FF54339|nr:hypothetical protein [Bacillus pinisoli]